MRCSTIGLCQLAATSEIVKALLVASLTRVNGAVTSVQTFSFTFEILGAHNRMSTIPLPLISQCHVAICRMRRRMVHKGRQWSRYRSKQLIRSSQREIINITTIRDADARSWPAHRRQLRKLPATSVRRCIFLNPATYDLPKYLGPTTARGRDSCTRGDSVSRSSNVARYCLKIFASTDEAQPAIHFALV